MPRFASRITLEITEVRVQRLQDITEEDALAEGIPLGPIPGFPEVRGDQIFNNARAGYCQLWDSIHGDGSWDLNPWVWALTFKWVTQ